MMRSPVSARSTSKYTLLWQSMYYAGLILASSANWLSFTEQKTSIAIACSAAGGALLLSPLLANLHTNLEDVVVQSRKRFALLSISLCLLIANGIGFAYHYHNLNEKFPLAVGTLAAFYAPTILYLALVERVCYVKKVTEKNMAALAKEGPLRLALRHYATFPKGSLNVSAAVVVTPNPMAQVAPPKVDKRGYVVVRGASADASAVWHVPGAPGLKVVRVKMDAQPSLQERPDTSRKAAQVLSLDEALSGGVGYSPQHSTHHF